MDTLAADVRYAVRTVGRDPAFAAAVVLTLAMGIGASTTMFSIVNAVLLRPLPYAESDRIVSIAIKGRRSGLGEAVTDRDYVAWQNESRAITRFAAYSPRSANLSGGSAPEHAEGANVTAELFPLLNVRPILGRVFTAEDDRPGGPPVIILSYELWQRRFGADDVIGRTVSLDAQPFAVIGVMPPATGFPWRASFWTPLAMEVSESNISYMSVVGRLAPSVTPSQARAELARLGQRTDAILPASVHGSVDVVTLHERLYGDSRPALLVLLGVVILVLLIACANVAGLGLARTAGRHRQIAMQAMLGAGTLRLVRQALTEALVLALAAGALGTLIAHWGVAVLAARGPEIVDRSQATRIDVPVLAFAIAATLIAGIAPGLGQALIVARGDLLTASLRGHGERTGHGAGRSRLRGALVAGELALVLLLLVGAGLLLESFGRMLAVDPGFRARGILSISVDLPAAKYSSTSARNVFFEQLAQRVRSVPGVESAMLAYGPFQGPSMIGPVNVGGVKHLLSIVGTPADTNYFRLLGIPIVRGRAFAADDRAGSPRVAVLNETLARLLFADGDPIGKVLELGYAKGARVVGVAKDVRQIDLFSESLPQVYSPLAQVSRLPGNLVIRATRDPHSLIGPIQRVILDLDPDQPVSRAETLDERLAEQVAPQRFVSWLVATFAAIALSLAIVGLYGLMSYLVAQRTHEIGVRTALGAQWHDVMILVAREGVRLTGIGLVIGVAGAVALTRLMGHLLFNVSPLDISVFLIASAVLIAAALLGCYVPARRAARINPVIALRAE